MTTLGQTIGKIVDNFSIKNDAGDTVQLRVTFDFSTASDNDVKSWLCGNRRIALQRPSRSLSKTEIEDIDKTTIMAIDAGKKVKSHAERMAMVVGVGIPEELAEFALENPAKLDEIMALVNKAKNDNEDDND